ncbi:hypothetical protein QFZ20_000648 [Flavobacterium sp. W4I14]|nr:hypothetical protein [Flavobacterium sp. W4I14]
MYHKGDFTSELSYCSMDSYGAPTDENQEKSSKHLKEYLQVLRQATIDRIME